MMQLDLLSRFKGLTQDLVIYCEGQSEVGSLILAAPQRVQFETEEVEDPELTKDIQAVLTEVVTSATGSSNRFARALVMVEPTSVGDVEITPNGSLNVHDEIARRKELLTRPYNDDAAMIKPK